MFIKALQHCGLIVRDLEQTRRFYGTVLEMEEIPRPPNFVFRGAWFRQDSSEIHVILAADTTAPAGLLDPGPGKHNGLATHMAFEVHDLSALQTRLDAHRVEIVGGPIPRGDGMRQLFVHDPDGYLIEFFERTDISVEAATRGPVHRAVDRPNAVDPAEGLRPVGARQSSNE